MTMSISHDPIHAMTQSKQIVTHLIAILIGILSALILLTEEVDAASLSVNPITPDAFYSVSGRVSNGANEPILDAQIALLQPVGLEGSVEYATTTTDAQGAYHYIVNHSMICGIFVEKSLALTRCSC